MSGEATPIVKDPDIVIFWIGLSILGGALVLLIINHESGRVSGIDAYDFAAIAQYTALIALLGAGVLAAYRRRVRDGLRHALVWIVMGITLVAIYGMRNDLLRLGNSFLAVLVPGHPSEQRSVNGLNLVTLHRRADGHFVANVQIEEASIRMIVDTGASTIVLRAEDADLIGMNLNEMNYSAPVTTANGKAMAAPVRLDSVAIGSLRYSAIHALVAQPGVLAESLLGNSFLERLVSYEVTGDTLILRGHP